MIFAPNGGGGGINRWATNFIYGVDDVVFYNKSTYLCITGHTAAAVFETDFASGKWQLLSQMLPNYISDYDGTNIGKWATYADAAGTSPVDGTGGSPTVTYAVSTDSSLRGTTNFLFTHGASNQQGQGFSYDFSIDPSDKGKVLQIYMEYLIASGTYASGDLTFWIYDVTNSTLIQPAPYSLQNSSIIEKFGLEFQTSSSSTSYRLIGHVASSTATAYTIRFGNWNLGPQAKLYGSPITDWVSYTPTGSWVSNTTYSGQYRKVGDSLEVQVRLSLTGAPTAATLTVNLPSGFTIDTSKIPTAAQFFTSIFGSAAASRGGTGTGLFVKYNSTTSVTLDYITSVATAAMSLVNATAPVTWANGDIITMTFKVPILGWSSSVVMSSDAATNIVSLTALRTGSNITATAGAETEIVFNTIETNGDTGGNYSTTTGRFTASVPGWYRYSSNTLATTGAIAPTNVNYYAKKNGTGLTYGTSYSDNLTANKSQSVYTTDKIYLNAGEYFSIWANPTGQNITILNHATNHNTSLTVERISGPSQIAASDTVSALYIGGPPTGTLAGSYNLTTYGTKIKDSHGAYSSGIYTIPISGVYDISASNLQAATYSLGNYAAIMITVDGTNKYGQGVRAGGVIVDAQPSVSVKSVPLLAGQQISIKSFNNATTPTFSADSTLSYFSILRVGNY